MNMFIIDQKIIEEQAKHKKHCEYCGHTLTFYAFEKDRKVCSHCGYYNYKNDFVKFKYKLIEKGVRVAKCAQ